MRCHRLGVCLLLPCLCAGALGAPARVDLADHLPADALLFLQVPRFAAWEAVAKEGLAARLLEVPGIRRAFQPFVEELEARGHRVVAAALARIGLSPEALERHLAPGGLTIAVPGLSGEVMGNVAPRLLAALDLAGTDDEVWGLLERIVAAAGEGVTLSAPEAGIRRLSFRRGPPLALARVGESLLAAGDPDEIRAIRERIASGRRLASSLAAAPSFRRCRERIGEDPLLFAYANVRRLLETFRTVMREPEVEQAVDVAAIFGLSSIEGAALGLAWRGSEPLATAYLDFPGGREGLFAVPSAAKLDPSLMDRVPPDAFLAWGSGWDPAGCWRRFVRFAGSLPEVGPFFTAKVTELERVLGIGIEADLLSAIGPAQVTWIAFPPEGGALPEAGMAVKLADPARFRAAVETVCGRLGGEVRRIPHGGRELLILEVPFVRAVSRIGEALGAELPPLEAIGPPLDRIPAARAFVQNLSTQTSCVLDGDVLLVTDYPLSMKRYLRDRGRAAAGSLGADPVFRKTVEGRIDGVTGFVYIRYDRALRCLYNTVVPLAQLLGGGPLRRLAGVDLAQLPTPEFIEEVFKGFLLTYRVEAKAMEVRANLPGDVGTVAAVSAVGAGLLVPMFAKPRADVRGLQCKNNLREIGRLAVLYVDQGGSRFFPHGPAGSVKPFQTLADWHKDLDPERFICPASGKEPAPRDAEGRFRLTRAHLSYLWTTARRMPTDSPRFPLACEEAPSHNGMRNVLFHDCSVRAIPEAEFQEKYARYFEPQRL